MAYPVQGSALPLRHVLEGQQQGITDGPPFRLWLPVQYRFCKYCKKTLRKHVLIKCFKRAHENTRMDS